MKNYSVDIYKGDILKNEFLYNSIKKLITPYYEDTTAILKREIQHCTCLYYIKNNEGVLAFFMTNWETLAGKPSVYLGLTSVDEKYQDKKLINLLYLRFIEDGYLFKERNNISPVFYLTTATPLIYYFIQKWSDKHAPDFNGNYTPENKKIAMAYCKEHNINVAKNNPFVLKNVAPQTRYSVKERKRIKDAIKATNFKLFENLGIDEENGDRLFMITSLPEKEVFLKIQHKYQKLIAALNYVS